MTGSAVRGGRGVVADAGEQHAVGVHEVARIAHLPDEDRLALVEPDDQGVGQAHRHRRVADGGQLGDRGGQRTGREEEQVLPLRGIEGGQHVGPIGEGGALELEVRRTRRPTSSRRRRSRRRQSSIASIAPARTGDRPAEARRTGRVRRTGAATLGRREAGRATGRAAAGRRGAGRSVTRVTAGDRSA